MADRTRTRPSGPVSPAPGFSMPAPPQMTRQRRVRPGAIGLGIALVVVFMLAGAALFLRTGQKQAFLSVAATVAYGQQITAQDLAVVSIAPAPGLAPIPAADRAQIVGRYAAVDLVPGTLLTRAQVTSAVMPAEGKQLVGIAVKSSQLPARALRPGDRVLLVTTPKDGTDVTGDPPTTAARVADVGKPDSNGTVTVDVEVDQSDGPELAALSAAGQLAIIVTARN